jgi:hypothetical protein
MTGEYRQFKLTNGEEMICELISTDPEGDSTADVIVRRAMKIVVTDDMENNIRFYTLKPWMSFIDDSLDLVALNSIHIVGEATPSSTVMRHYAAALADVDKYNKVKDIGLTFQEIEEKMKELSEEEMDAFLQQKFDELDSNMKNDGDDSGDTNNVIKFTPKGTIH